MVQANSRNKLRLMYHGGHWQLLRLILDFDGSYCRIVPIHWDYSWVRLLASVTGPEHRLLVVLGVGEWVLVGLVTVAMGCCGPLCQFGNGSYRHSGHTITLVDP